LWNKNLSCKDFVSRLGRVGFQSVELKRAADVVVKMKKSGAKVFLTFTSNMVTSGLRGFFAQLVRLKLVDVIVTTTGAIEEDIMRAFGEKFFVGSFRSDDVALYEQGVNRVGNLFISNESYAKFEAKIKGFLGDCFSAKPRWPVSELLREIGLKLDDVDSFLFQAAKNDVPVFCPGITDGAFGFHLFLFQQTHKDFVVDVVKDFANIVFSSNQDMKKGGIILGGGISKHHAIFSCLINGGLDFAVYLTTSNPASGSMSSATTSEAKSWGKIRDDSDAVTVFGDVSITFPLMMSFALEVLSDEGLIEDE